jgi:hypothetical protein
MWDSSDWSQFESEPMWQDSIQLMFFKMMQSTIPSPEPGPRPDPEPAPGSDPDVVPAIDPDSDRDSAPGTFPPIPEPAPI